MRSFFFFFLFLSILPLILLKLSLIPFLLIFNLRQRAWELALLLRAAVMIRRLKNDVLQELPPKRRQVVLLPVFPKDVPEIDSGPLTNFQAEELAKKGVDFVSLVDHDEVLDDGATLDDGETEEVQVIGEVLVPNEPPTTKKNCRLKSFLDKLKNDQEARMQEAEQTEEPPKKKSRKKSSPHFKSHRATGVSSDLLSSLFSAPSSSHDSKKIAPKICDLCGFVARTIGGLKNHSHQKHGGVTRFRSDTSSSTQITTLSSLIPTKQSSTTMSTPAIYRAHGGHLSIRYLNSGSR